VSRVTHVSSEFWKEGDVDTSLASIRARDDSYNELGAHRTREDQFILDSGSKDQTMLERLRYKFAPHCSNIYLCRFWIE